MFKTITIVGFLSATFFLTATAGLPSDNAFPTITDALKKVGDLKSGDNRAKLEQAFELDGGMQWRAHSRYVLKTCRYIKIDVEFSDERDGGQTDFLPTDRIVKISRPYLDYPVSD
jgi:hypothetical protein